MCWVWACKEQRSGELHRWHWRSAVPRRPPPSQHPDSATSPFSFSSTQGYLQTWPPVVGSRPAVSFHRSRIGLAWTCRWTCWSDSRGTSSPLLFVQRDRRIRCCSTPCSTLVLSRSLRVWWRGHGPPGSGSRRCERRRGSSPRCFERHRRACRPTICSTS